MKRKNLTYSGLSNSPHGIPTKNPFAKLRSTSLEFIDCLLRPSLSASDLVDEIQAVYLSIDGEFYEATLNGDYYTSAWTPASTGPYTISAYAEDLNSSLSETKEITVSVNQTPTVQLSSPTNGSMFDAPAPIQINAIANDPNGNETIEKVAFYEGDILIEEDFSFPYTTNWENVVEGNYSISARVYDNLGAFSNPTSIDITVTESMISCGGILKYGPYPNVYNSGDQVQYNNVIYKSQTNGLYNVTPGTAEHWWQTISNCSTAPKQVLTTIKSDIPPMEVTIYPNPANGIIAINLNGNLLNKGKMAVVDLSGDVKMETDEAIINTSQLSPGMYNVIITTIENTYFKKLVIQ